ncbi:MAG: ATP-binding protein [Chloroflexota bacterium]
MSVSSPTAVSLRTKLLIGTLLMLVPVLGLLLMVFNASYDRRREIVQESLLQTARGAAALVDATFDEAITLGQAVAGDPDIQTLDPDRVGPRLRRLGSGYDQYQTFFVFNRTGELIGVSGHGVTTPVSVADRAYFRRAIDTGQSTSFELLLGRQDGTVSTGVAVPIFNDADAPAGVLVIGFDLERLQDRIATIGLSGSQLIALFDPTGRLGLVATEHLHPMDRTFEQRDFSSVPEIRAALDGDPVVRTSFESPMAPQPLAAAVVRSPHHGWIAAAAWPAAEAFRPANEARFRELALFTGIAVAALGGTVLVANSLTRPVRQLAAGALEFGRGNLERRLDVQTGDEIGQLGQAFNTMATQIQGTLRELNAARSAAETGWHEAEVARAHAERAGRRATFLAEASAALSESLDYAATLQRVADLAVPTVADWCVVDIVEHNGRTNRVAAAHADPTKAGVMAELQHKYVPQPDWSEHPVAGVLASGQPLILAALDEAALRRFARDADHLGLLTSLGTTCIMVAPLWARGRTLGTMTYAIGESGRSYDAEDLTLAESLASRAAVAVDNARLYTETERAVRVRDEFLASASHELRTPISHIKGFVSTLRQRDVEWDDDVREDFLAEIERETDRLAKLIGDLLDMTRLESGGLDQVERLPLRPVDFVTGGLDRVRGLLRRHTVQVDVPASLPAVQGDASQLERVFANLVENATKFSPAGSTIRIAGHQVNGAVRLCVTDEGPGIPPDQIEQVFEKFYRGRNVTGNTPGTGLGLSICRHIVQAHGGHIWAESSQHGACLVVELPVAVFAPGGHP